MMGYSNGFIATILLKNKPLREFKYRGKRTVKVPFGSEYIIRLKNKSKDPALVQVSLDGTDVLNGSELILEAGETLDLERFVDDSSKGKKFKFISLEEGAKTGEIDDPYRKENGLIQIKFFKAAKIQSLTDSIIKEQGSPVPYPYYPPHPYYPQYIKTTTDGISYPTVTCGIKGNHYAEGVSPINFAGVASASCFVSNDLQQDKGATVEGSESTQAFSISSEYCKSGLNATTLDIYMVGPNFKEEVKKEWGVYLGKNKDPEASFKERKHANIFVSTTDFGKTAVTIKETS